MHDFYSDGNGRLELPISSVRPKRTHEEISRALAEFELIALSSEDEGFLRLAKEVFNQPAAGESARSTADWDNGLLS